MSNEYIHRAEALSSVLAELDAEDILTPNVRNSLEAKLFAAENDGKSIQRGYREQGDILLALIRSRLFTQDQIDHLAYGLAMGEDVTRSKDGGKTAEQIVDAVSRLDVNGVDLNRLYRALSGNPTTQSVGEYSNEDRGSKHLLVEINARNPETAARVLREVADDLADGKIADDHGPQNRYIGFDGGRTAAACWQTRCTGSSMPETALSNEELERQQQEEAAERGWGED